MRTLILAICLSVSACSPLHYAKTGRCATATTLVTDFVIASALLAGSVERYTAREGAQSIALLGAAMGVGLAANLSETACK